MDINTVNIQLNLNITQVNLILEGLGKLSIDRAEGLFNGIRQYSVQVLQQAEAAEQANKEPADADPHLQLVPAAYPEPANDPSAHPEVLPDTK